MAEFDDKLNALLSNPDSMAQIMQLAQSLSGGGAGAAQQPPASQPAGGAEGPPPQAAFLAGPSPAQPGGRSPSGGGGGMGLLSSLGGLDPKILSRLLPLLQEWNTPQDGNARQLLMALQPYLKPERQGKVERALQLARLVRLGRKLLSSWEG